MYITIVIFILFCGCSTKNNTWLSRNYHAMTTRYNVAFNSGESYKEGLDVIYNENEDDFTKVESVTPDSSEVLEVYDISLENAKRLLSSSEKSYPVLCATTENGSAFCAIDNTQVCVSIAGLAKTA